MRELSAARQTRRTLTAEEIRAYPVSSLGNLIQIVFCKVVFLRCGQIGHDPALVAIAGKAFPNHLPERRFALHSSNGV
jgi:hypothetical protein